MDRPPLEQLRRHFEQVTDGLGLPIDRDIIDAVVACNAWGLVTSQSCQGHIDQPGLPYPWVEIYPPEPQQPEWWKDDRLVAAMAKTEAELHSRAVTLLQKFYDQHQASYEVMLGFRAVGYGFRIQSHGAEAMSLLDLAERRQKHLVYLQEMQAFAAFATAAYEAGEEW